MNGTIRQVVHQALLGKPNVSEPTLLPAALKAQPVESNTSPEKDNGDAATAEPLTFDQTIATALKADPKIRAGIEAINQANADFWTASLFPNPSYFGDVQLLPLDRAFTVTRQGGPPQMDQQLSYPIDWFLFGKRAANMASTAAGVRVSEADYADLIRKRVTDTALAYYDLLEAKALLSLAKEDLDSLRKVEAATKKAVDAGGRPLVDLTRARLDVLKSEQSLREATSNVAIARAKLRAQIGRRDQDPDFDIAGNLEGPLSTEPLAAEEALTLADRNRPDIKSLRLQIEKAARDVHTEKTKCYPQVTPQMGYTRQFQMEATGFPDASSWSAGLTVSLPIFDRNQGNRAKASSVLVQNTHNLEAGLVDLRAEIVQVTQDFQTTYQTATAVTNEQLKAAADVRDAINKAFDAGGRSLLEVLDAQRTYRETYRLHINSRANYWRALQRFHSAIGQQLQR